MSVYRMVVANASLLTCFLVSSLASAQLPSFVPKGIGIEAGGGHNELMWWVEDGDNGHRRQIQWAPNVRLHYQRTVLGKVALMPFVGYNVTGGRSGASEATSLSSPGGANQPIYRDAFRFRTFEAGNVASYTLGSFSVGAGLKLNRFLAVRHEVTIEDDDVSETFEEDRSAMFKTWSLNGGMRLEYGLGDVIVATEGWFGLTGIDDGFFSSVVHVRENHYRVLVGYRLK